MLPTVKVDLGNGDYVEIYEHCLGRTKQAIAEFCLPLLANAKTPEEKDAALAPHQDEILELAFKNQVERVRIATPSHRFGLRRMKVHVFTRPFDYKAVLAAFAEVDVEKWNILRDKVIERSNPRPLAGSDSVKPQS